MSDMGPVPAKGSTKDYCSYLPGGPEIEGDAHHMSSYTTGSKDIPWIERCSFCGWIDGDALQRYADAIKKMSVAERAQRIAIAMGTEPFAFVEVLEHETALTLDEILAQALGAASMSWVGGTGELEFDSTRAKQIWTALKAEVDRAIEVEQAEALSSAERRVRNYMQTQFITAHIDSVAARIRVQDA